MYGESKPNHYVVTPSDTTDLEINADYLLIENPTSVMCQVKLSDMRGVATVHYLPAGQYYWGKVKRIWATDLTAGTQIVAYL